MCNCGGGAIRNIALRKEAARRTVEAATGGGVPKKARSARAPAPAPSPAPVAGSRGPVRSQPIVSITKARNNVLFLPKSMRKQRHGPVSAAPTPIPAPVPVPEPIMEILTPEVLANVNSVWGPPLWRALHSLAEITEDVAVWEGLLEKVHSTMPCPECAAHFGEWIRTHPLYVSVEEGLTVSESVRIWLLTLHNDVNRRTGKPEWTVEQLTAASSAAAVDSVRSVLGDIRTYISVELGDAIESSLTVRRTSGSIRPLQRGQNLATSCEGQTESFLTDRIKPEAILVRVEEEAADVVVDVVVEEVVDVVVEEAA